MVLWWTEKVLQIKVNKTKKLIPENITNILLSLSRTKL